jgi:glycine betaine/proline transport system substrate-binding protein
METRLARTLTLLLTVAAISGVGGAHAAGLGAVNEPIKLAINEWTGQHVSTRIAGGILERMGYQVEYVTAGAVPQFAALADGTIHMQPEVWTNNVGDVYPKAIEKGQIIELGLLGLNNREGWIYPKYMEQMCPGLPAMEALLACTEKIATTDTFPNGRVVAYPADWGTRTADLIQVMDMPLSAVPGGSEGAMVAELKAAVTKKEPLVMMFWAPHWVLSEVDVGWVEIVPSYEPACHEDASWGPNPNATHDCAFAQAAVTKSVWAGVQDKWPAAYAFMEQYQLSGADQQVMMKAIDVDGQKLDDVVAAWIDGNQSTWKPWAEKAKN